MKRTLHRVSLIGVLALALTLGACDLTELNTNPNEPSQATVPYLFTNAQLSIAQDYWGTFELGRFGNLYAEYWSQTQYITESRFQYPTSRPGSNSALWNAYYLALNDLQKVIEIARQEPERAGNYGNPQDIIAMAKVLQVWVWQVLTDVYGPVPFTDALGARENPQPAYTPQSEIYPALVDTLAKYAPQFTGNTAIASGDVFFSGDTGLWQAFANGLRMRLAIRMADANPEVAQTAFQDAYDATSFTDVPEYQQVLLPFGSGSSPYPNPFYNTHVLGGRDDWGVSEPLLSLMNSVEDPRRGGFAQLSASTGEYIGFPYGLTSGPANAFWGQNNFSRPSERVYETAEAPAIFFTEAEELFSLAEAAERWGIGAMTAAEYYQQAIIASAIYWGATEAEAQAYAASVPYDNSNGWAPSGPVTWKQTLGIQKWIALYMQGIQGWSVFRRLDFQGVLVSPPGDPGLQIFGKIFPVRLPYPREEPSLNTTNHEEAVSTLGGSDNQGTRLWWDVNPQAPPAE